MWNTEQDIGFAHGIEDDFTKLTAEESLLVAIVERAVRDTNLPSYEKFRDDARRWLRSDSCEEWTFLWICNQLMLSTTCIKRLREYANLDGY